MSTVEQNADLSAIQRNKPYQSETAIRYGLMLCAAASVLTTVGIVVILLWESVQFFSLPEVTLKKFLTGTEWTPLFNEEQREFGILPLVCGTFLVTLGAIMVAGPLGLGAAIYLSEYASSTVREIVKPILEVLAGIPSVVYGVIAITTVSPCIRYLFDSDSVYNALSAGIVVGFMILPMIISLSEDVLRSVPRELRSAAYALGATKLDVTMRVVVPAALSGIVASFLLAISRAIGESMAVTLAAGGEPTMTLNMLEGVQTMTAYIVSVSAGDAPAGSIAFKAMFAVGFALFVITLFINIIAQWVLSRMREQYE